MSWQSGTISGRGASASWTSQQNNVIRIWNMFSVHSPDVRALLPVPWSELPEEILCTNDKGHLRKVCSLFVARLCD